MKNRYKKYEDLELAEIICKKNNDSELAFKELYDRYSAVVHAYCYRVVGDYDQAEDVFQETFIKFYQYVDNRDNANVKAYLFKIARNVHYNSMRNKKPTVDIENVENFIHEYVSYDQLEMNEIVRKSINLLNDEYKEIFVMREYSDLSYRDIAELLQISEENAKTRFFRAKQKLMTIVKPYMQEYKTISLKERR
ncbi:MAG: RNA polymerase sigma factor [bacterium]